MSLPPSRPIIDALRDGLRTLESKPEPVTPEKSELMQQLRKHIAAIEAAQRFARLGQQDMAPLEIICEPRAEGPDLGQAQT